MRRVASFFFLSTLFACTFEKVHWTVPGAGDVNVADLFALCFLGAFAIVTRPRVPRTTAVVLAFFAALPDRLPRRLLQPRDAPGPPAVHEGDGEVRHPLPLPRGGGGVALPPRRRVLLARARVVLRRDHGQLGLRRAAARRRVGGGSTSTRRSCSRSPAAPRKINIYGAVEGSSVFRLNALSGDPNHLGIMLIVPLLVLTPIYLRLEPGHRLRGRIGRADRVPARGRARDALAQRPARPRPSAR